MGGSKKSRGHDSKKKSLRNIMALRMDKVRNAKYNVNKTSEDLEVGDAMQISYPNIENTIAPLHDENSLDISGVHEIDDGDSYETTEENHSGHCLNIEHTITPQYNQNSLEISGVDEINEVDSYKIAKENHGEENILKQDFGRRIVDIMFIFKQIKKSRHIGGFGCTFLDMQFVAETQNGFRSSFKFLCDMCNCQLIVYSEEKVSPSCIPINEAIVSGTVAAGIGYTQLSELSASIDIPCMSNTTYSLVLSKMGNTMHNAALQEMKLAGEEERKYALETNCVDDDGVPMCTVVADGQWSKRSYKTKYDALSGVATIIGYKSKKILFIGIRNRYCVVCQRAANTNTTVPKHTCFLNWTKGATSMEADAIAEGFRRSVEIHGLKFNKLIGDGDSSVTKRLRELMPYGPN